jgi:ankyrin repeat protein
MAARRGHIACVQALLEGGSATNATNKDGYTALHHAANDGHFTCVTALVSAGARR